MICSPECAADSLLGLSLNMKLDKYSLRLITWCIPSFLFKSLSTVCVNDSQS